MKLSRSLPALASDSPPAQQIPMIPAPYAQSIMSMPQLLAILRARRSQVIVIALAFLIASVAVVKLLPKRYTAQATVLVSFESDENTRQTPADLYASYLVTQVELLQNREVLMTVIDRLGLTQDRELTRGFKNDGVGTLRDWVEKQVRTNLVVEQGKGSQLLYVSYTANDRNRAAQIANAIVDVYQAHESKYGTDSSSRRAHEYSQQLADLKAKVSAAEQQMEDFRQRTGVTDITAQNDVETQALAALEQQLLTAQNARRTAESRTVDDQGVSDPVMASPLVQNLKAQISALQAELANSSAVLGPKHPKVLELQSQIDAARRSLQHEIQTFSQNTSSTVSSSAQLESKLRHAVEDQQAKLVRLRKLQDEGQKLQLELDSARAVYKRALDSYDQVMFASSSVVAPAPVPLEASKPNKILLLAIGILFSLATGVAIPLINELIFNRRLHCREDFEREMGLPVLAEFDGIPAMPRIQ